MKGKKRAAVLLGALAAVLALALGGFALAANPEHVTVTAPVAQTIRLSVSKNAVNFGGGNLDPETGSYADSLTATVRSNVNWRLQVEKNRDLTGVDPANVIPSGQLTFTSSSGNPRVTAVRSSATQFGATGSPTMVAEGTKGNNIDVSVNYALTVTWDESPDTYSATHTYTVIAR